MQLFEYIPSNAIIIKKLQQDYNNNYDKTWDTLGQYRNSINFRLFETILHKRFKGKYQTFRRIIFL